MSGSKTLRFGRSKKALIQDLVGLLVRKNDDNKSEL